MVRRSTSGLTRSKQAKVTKMRFIPLLVGVEDICSISLALDDKKCS